MERQEKINDRDRIKSILFWSLRYFERNGGYLYYGKDIIEARKFLEIIMGEDPYDRTDISDRASSKS